MREECLPRKSGLWPIFQIKTVKDDWYSVLLIEKVSQNHFPLLRHLRSASLLAERVKRLIEIFDMAAIIIPDQDISTMFPLI